MPLEWVEGRYGGSRAHLGHGLELSVQWEGTSRLGNDEPQWNVYVFGRRLEKRSPEQEHGQKRAEAAAKKWLTEALEKLV
jgi:hypothetical protein